MSKQTMDMTQGPLVGKILRFSLPLMVTNLLQMLFNAADVVVVGQFAGYDSLAAVGSTSSIICLFTNLLIGLGVGINVLIANFVGAGNRQKDIFLTLHTAITVGAVGGVVLGALGFVLTPWILRLVSTPADIFAKTVLYLRIYFLGSVFVMLYNYGTAVLRAIGDTRRPLIFLLISGLTNVVLNLYFVIGLGWDVAGVGVATVISQLLSAFLVLRCLSREKGAWRYHWKCFFVHRQSLYEICRIGIPAGIQACLFSLSNVAIQGAINAYGSIIVAANSAAANIENFLYIAINSFHQASMTFISQNLGAGKWARVKKVAATCLTLAFFLGLFEGLCMLLWSPQLMELFNGNPQVIAAGTVRLHWVGALYVIFGCADVLVGSIRGSGITMGPMLINLLGTCLFRLVWIWYIKAPAVPVEMVYLSYPISWVLILIALSFYWVYVYRHYASRHNNQVKKLAAENG